MSSCLGMYIEENIIKYAKVSKEHEQLKVETFGVKFYDNFEQAIKQIIEETYSYKIPISINLSDELYNYFQVFGLLNKKDIPKAIQTEFEAYCGEKNYNYNVFESRYAITPDVQEKGKLKVIHISENKIELNKKIQRFNGYRLQNITPISMAISNIAQFNERENALIVNIEQKTTITTVLNQNIYNIDILDYGSKDILDKINLKENSYQKAYNICKETTIYTSEGRELTEEETGYLEDIMLTLYNIVGSVRKILNESTEKIEKIYITGTGALINNIDLYFEDYLENVKCEILRPSFIKISPEINLKDYIEVNSAISLALSGLGQGITGMNFKKANLLDKLPDIMKIEIGGKKNKDTEPKFKGDLFTFDFNIPLDFIEKSLIRASSGFLIMLVVFCLFSSMIGKQIEKKNLEANQSMENTNKQIQSIKTDITKADSIKKKYEDEIAKINEQSEKSSDILATKKQIPNLLNNLMYIMPEGVQIVSIKNTTARHIEIQAQSSLYEQLGYLTANISTKAILINTVSTLGQKENNIITVKIEGDMP